jgi:hypothetical protein
VHFILFQRKLKANEFGKFAFSDSPWLNASIFLPKRVKHSRKVLLDFDSINDLNIWLKNQALLDLPWSNPTSFGYC